MASLLDLLDGAGAGSGLIGAGALLAVAGLLLAAVRIAVVPALTRLITRSRTAWDDVLVARGVLARLAPLPSLVLLLVGVPLVPDLADGLVEGVGRVLLSLVVLAVLRAAFAALDAANDVYSALHFAAERPIKGYLQLVKLLLAVVAGVLIVSFLTGRSPGLLLSGLGAATAVLLLVFRDTILSLVASLQLASNDMVRVGDWISMPSRGADGDVVDIALHTVKVQNFDKTIVTLPTHVLANESFVNWRGMSESGGRRIKRAVLLDQTSVHFLSDAEVERFAGWPLLAEHVASKRRELGVEGGGHDPDAAATRAARRLTNLGMFRAYVTAYLRQRPDIHHDGMTLMVRQLAPGPDGLPLELYAFTATTDWVTYEGIQADVFDHLLAILPSFGLRVHQRPGSADLAALGSRDQAAPAGGITG